MRKIDAWMVAIGTATGLAAGIVGTRLYEFSRRQDPGIFSHEFEVHSVHPINWRGGIGEDVVVEFRSFVTRKGARLREGPSFQWRPAAGDRNVEFYRNGSAESVESHSVNAD